MTKKKVMKDTGKKKRQFSTGAVRDNDDDKPKLALISPIFMTRLGNWLAKGAKKYSPRNWEAGIPVEASLNSLMRHVNDYREGKKDEDHLAAIACNIMFIIHTEEMIERDLLPKELSFLPNYLERKKK